VAAVANPVANLWSVPVLDGVAGESDVRPYPVPTDRALAPRFSATALYYLSSLGGGDGLWRVENGEAAEIWRGAEGVLREPPAISADGRRVAIVRRREGRQSLTVIEADGSQPRVLAEALDVRGAASWSPDGQWIATGGFDADGNGLFKVPADGGAPVRLAAVGFNPAWSPRGDLIVYSLADVGGNVSMAAVTAVGEPVEMPAILVRQGGERFRFLPDGSGLLYMQGGFDEQDFWLLDVATKQSRQLTQLSKTDAMRSFDITPDGRQIVFDRQRWNSDIVLIDLPQAP
jgi:Tol biopolymer transport system component